MILPNDKAEMPKITIAERYGRSGKIFREFQDRWYIGCVGMNFNRQAGSACRASHIFWNPGRVWQSVIHARIVGNCSISGV